MTGIGGKILATPEDLQTKTDRKESHVGVIHFPKDSNVIYFSSWFKHQNRQGHLPSHHPRRQVHRHQEAGRTREHWL